MTGVRWRRRPAALSGLIALALAMATLPADRAAAAAVPPVIHSPADGLTTTNDRVGITGSGHIDAIVEVEIDGTVATPQVAVDAAGWRYDPAQLWAPGAHRVRARQYVDDEPSAWTPQRQFTVGGPPEIRLVASSSWIELGSSLLLTVTARPGSLTGTVTLLDQVATGPDTGKTLDLGTWPLQSGIVTWQRTLPSFGRHSITARYNGDGQIAPMTSAPVAVEAQGVRNGLMITEARSSGPGGAKDCYLELGNAWQGYPVPLRGVSITSGSGQTFVLPDDAPYLDPGRNYLIGGPDFTLDGTATPDFTADVGSGGWTIRVPDTANTRVGFVDSTNAPQLRELTGTPSQSWALVRQFENGGPAVSYPFYLASADGAEVGGVPATRGAASPTGLADPYLQPGQLRSTRLDRGSSVADPPNRAYTPGSPGRLVVRRTITNVSKQTVTAARVRMITLSEVNGPSAPSYPQPSVVARLRWVDGFDGPSSPVETRQRGAVTVLNLSPGPVHGPSGGGLNSTVDLPLPTDGLAPGGSIDVAFNFAVDSGGHFWFGYTVDTLTED